MALLKPTVILTGANGGLGIGYVQNLIASPYAATHHAIYLVRNPANSTTLNDLLKSKAPKDHSWEVIAIDFASLAIVRKVASEINGRVTNQSLGPISGLILNAGWQEANHTTLTPQTQTAEGLEANFGVNYLSQFLMVLLLLQSMDKEHGRIVIVSSYMHDSLDSRHNQNDLYKSGKQGGQDHTEMFTSVKEWKDGIVYTDSGHKGGLRRYGQSKLACVMFMYELQRRLSRDPALSQISILNLDPGAMGDTNITRTAPPHIKVLILILAWIGPVFVFFNPNGTIRTSFKSGNDLLKAGFERGQPYGEHPQAMFLDGSLKGESSIESRDEVKQKALWEGSVELAGLKEGETALKGWR